MTSGRTAMPITRVGIIGTGVMGSDHARILASSVAGAELAGVFDVDQARASALAKETGARVFDDATALVADRGIDAIIVCSPDATHNELALACIAADKPA